MQVKLVQAGEHADWAKDEIVVVQVVGEKDDAGAYECETLETFAPDLKEQHAKELEQLHAHYAEQHNNLVVRHVNTVDELTALLNDARAEVDRLSGKAPDPHTPTPEQRKALEQPKA